MVAVDHVERVHASDIQVGASCRVDGVVPGVVKDEAFGGLDGGVGLLALVRDDVVALGLGVGTVVVLVPSVRRS